MERIYCNLKFKNYLSLYKIGRYFAFVMLIYQIIELTREYLKYKTVLKIEFKHSDKREFPTLTVCINMNENYIDSNNYTYYSPPIIGNNPEVHVFNDNALILLYSLKFYAMHFYLNNNVTYNLIKLNLSENEVFDDFIISSTLYSRRCVTAFSGLGPKPIKVPLTKIPLSEIILSKFRNHTSYSLIIHPFRTPPHLYEYLKIPIIWGKYYGLQYSIKTECLQPPPYETKCYNYLQNEGTHKPKSYDDCVVKYAHNYEQTKCGFNRHWNYYYSIEIDHNTIINCDVL